MDSNLIIKRWCKVIADQISEEPKQVLRWAIHTKQTEFSLSRIYLGLRFSTIKHNELSSAVIALNNFEVSNGQ